MAEDGLIGFLYKGAKKITYHPSASTPEALGYQVAIFCSRTPVEVMKAGFDKIKMVTARTEPTDKQVEECRRWMAPGGNEKDWACLLGKTQGDLSAYFIWRRCKYMIDGSKSIGSIFFKYIVNLDTEKLEFWTYVDFSKPLAEFDLNSFPHPKEAAWAMIEALKGVDDSYQTYSGSLDGAYGQLIELVNQ
jgi:hypothetical protein